MCEFPESACNGFGDIWWTDNPIYFSSIYVMNGQSFIECYSRNGKTPPILESLPRPSDLLHRIRDPTIIFTVSMQYTQQGGYFCFP